MARIGLHGLQYALLTNEDTEIYAVPAVIGGAVGAKLAYELNSAELYADNSLTESDYSFNKGTLTLTVSDDDDAVLAALLGRTIDPTTKEVIRTTEDVAPFVGVGRVITKLVSGAYKYKAEFLAKVKFKEPAPEDKTKGASVEFGTVDLEGTIAALPNKKWSKSATFDTKAAAEAYIDTCFDVV